MKECFQILKVFYQITIYHNLCFTGLFYIDRARCVVFSQFHEYQLLGYTQGVFVLFFRNLENHRKVSALLLYIQILPISFVLQIHIYK